jgi:LacI family transcriptional regulator
MAKKTTLEDIAREAGVSAQTVSRVINNRPDVSRATRQRVQAIIDRLGYQPNAVARSLSAKRTWMMGVVIGSLDQFGPRSIFLELDKQAFAAGYRLLPYIIHDEDTIDIAGYFRELRAHQPDGIIWAVIERERHEEILRQFVIEPSIPLVTMETAIPGVPKPAVLDQVTPSITLVNHLIEQGYRRIGIIVGLHSAATKRGNQRLEGWRQAMQAAGLPTEARQIAEGDWSAASGERGMAQLLAQFPEMDAVYACNDQMALGVLNYAHRHGIHVPGDMGLVGFDDLPEAPFFDPPLTTARQPFDEFCAITVQTLATMIDVNLVGEAYTPPATTILYPEVLIRASSVRGASPAQ